LGSWCDMTTGKELSQRERNAEEPSDTYTKYE